MKRRNFISASSLVVAVGATTTSLTAASSIYTSISSSVSLEEFTPVTQSTLNHFINELETTLDSHSIDKKIAKKIAMPVRVISKENSRDNEQIVYKNQSGQYVKLSTKKGVQTVYISNDLPK